MISQNWVPSIPLTLCPQPCPQKAIHATSHNQKQGRGEDWEGSALLLTCRCSLMASNSIPSLLPPHCLIIVYHHHHETSFSIWYPPHAVLPLPWFDCCFCANVSTIEGGPLTAGIGFDDDNDDIDSTSPPTIVIVLILLPPFPPSLYLSSLTANYQSNNDDDAGSVTSSNAFVVIAPPP